MDNHHVTSAHEQFILGDILSMGMTIISYVMLFVFTLILLPSYIWQKNIKYVDIVQVFYVSLLFSMGISILAGWNDPESFHLDPYSLRNRYLAYFQHPNSVGLYAFFWSQSVSDPVLASSPFYLYAHASLLFDTD